MSVFIKYKSVFVSAGIFLMIAGLFAIAGFSKMNSPARTAFVLPQKLFKDFNGSKDLEKKIIKLQEKQKTMLDSLLTEIKFLEKAAVSKDQINKLIQKKEVYNKVLAQFEQGNKEEFQEYSQALWQQINQYLSEYGKQNNYMYIYGADGSGNLMYADSTMNITDEVVIFINKKYAGN